MIAGFIGQATMQIENVVFNLHGKTTPAKGYYFGYQWVLPPELRSVGRGF